MNKFFKNTNNDNFDDNILSLNFMFDNYASMAKQSVYAVNFFKQKLNDYENWKFKYIIFEVEQLPFAFSTYFVPDDNLEASNDDSYIFLASIPNEKCTFLICAWFDEHNEFIKKHSPQWVGMLLLPKK